VNRGVDVRLLCLVLFIFALSMGILVVVIPLFSYSLGADRLVGWLVGLKFKPPKPHGHRSFLTIGYVR